VEVRDHSEDMCLNDWIILEWIFVATGWNGVVWINLRQDNDLSLAVVNTVMNFQAPWREISELIEGLLASQERLFSMELVSYLNI
jgi:hypothetical protein